MKKSSYRIAVLCALQGYSARVVRGIKDFARPYKPWLIHFVPPGPAAVETLRYWQPDGIIGSLTTQAQADALVALNIPIVNYAFFLNRTDIAHLGQDDEAIGRTAGEHLLARGFRSYAYIGDPQLALSDKRERGFAQIVKKRGHTYSTHAESSAWDGRKAVNWSERDERVRAWLRKLPKPVGVMAANDHWGWQVSEICLNAGINIPDELALVGVDNDELLCEMAYPTLSSVDTQPERIGYRAAAVLERMMRGARPPKRRQLFRPVRVILRASTDVVAVPDADVANAVRFIRERAAEGISVEQVVAHLAVSRRLLERKFKQHLQRTPLEEIHLRRIERARNLLCDTDLSVGAIARAAGFGERQRFSAIFQRLTGKTASAYRASLRRES